MKYEAIRKVAFDLRQRAILHDGRPSPFRVELKDSQGQEAVLLFEDDSDLLTVSLGDPEKLIGDVRIRFITANGFRYPVHIVSETA